MFLAKLVIISISDKEYFQDCNKEYQHFMITCFFFPFLIFKVSFSASFPLSTNEVVSVVHEIFLLYFIFEVCEYKIFIWRAKILFSAWSWFGLLSKRDEEVDDSSVVVLVDERVEADEEMEVAYDEVDDVDT